MTYLASIDELFEGGEGRRKPVLRGSVGAPDPHSRTVTIVHISDTHLRHNKYIDKIPPGDILIHSGDFSQLAVSR